MRWFLRRRSFGGETSGSVAKCRLFSQAMSSRVSAFVVPSGAHLMSIPDLELGRVKLSYSKFKAKKNLTVSSLRDGECESMESQFRCS